MQFIAKYALGINKSNENYLSKDLETFLGKETHETFRIQNTSFSWNLSYIRYIISIVIHVSHLPFDIKRKVNKIGKKVICSVIVSGWLSKDALRCGYDV